MALSIRIVFIKQNPQEDSGTVYIRTIENRKARKKSTGIKLLESDWIKYFNESKSRFRKDKRFPEYEEYNERIDEILDEIGKYGNQLDYIPNHKKSFLVYWESMLKGYSNHGTIIKHQGVKKKLDKYLTSINKEDLLFSEITPIFLRQLRVYLQTVRDPKCLSENVANHYLKIIQSVINQAASDDYYTYIKHPFLGLKFSKKKVLKDVLNEYEIERLIQTEIENKKLDRARNMFLFQMFSNGMRVSDVLLLRWENIQGSRLKYEMYKTGTEMNIPINVNMSIILGGSLGIRDRYEELLNNLVEKFVNPYQRPTPFGNSERSYTLRELDELIDKHSVKGGGNRVVKSPRVSGTFKRAEVIDYKGFSIFRDDEKIQSVIDKREELLENIDKMFTASVIGRIRKMSKKDLKKFVFPLINDDKIGSKGVFTEEEYKRIKHSTIVYNRQLKKVQELCGIETNLTSHVARHSYTNLLLGMEGVNLYDISQSLGHSNIKTTESYLRSGFNVDKVDYLNQKVSKSHTMGRR